MSFESPIILSPFHLIGQDLFPFTLLDDFSFDDDIGEMGSPNLCLTFFGDHQDIFQFHLIPYFSLQFLYADEVSLGDPIFLSASFTTAYIRRLRIKIISEY